MLIDAPRSQLLVIDVQARLVPAIAEHESVVGSIVWLTRAAQKVGVPVAATEQYPKGLGHLVPALRDLLPEGAIASKMHFSCVAAKCPALELVEEGKEVYVVADAVGSRRTLDRDLALWRMREEGVRVVSREMVVFEWLGEAGTPLFRDVSREFLR
jgi:nicotinamidase-related amidase